MSLLNNALREAEERQRRPGVAAAYTGAVQQGRGGQRWLVVLVFLIALGLTGAGVYWFAVANTSSPEATDRGVSEAPAQGLVERPTDVSEEVAEPRLRVEAPKPVSERVQKATPETIEPVDVVVADNPPEAPEPGPPAEQMAPSPKPAVDAMEQKPNQKQEQAAAVKTAPQSPRAIDRQTAKELETLIANGRMVAAERRLAGLVQTQAAPRSRFTVARALIVDGEIGRALSWLPEEAAAGDAALRMLRARAQHADGQLDAAVATLKINVPAVSEQPAYRVTLATLLQQQGLGQEAVVHWAELIAWDDSRAPWWVGLAIALEDQGEVRGATRAYEQASSLPGLSPSLADYVRRRLQSLRAG